MWLSNLSHVNIVLGTNMEKWLQKSRHVSAELRKSVPIALNLLQMDTQAGRVPYFQRYICIHSNNTPLIYAKTVMDQASHEHFFAQLKDLKDQFIGETMLYNDPLIKRSGFEYQVSSTPEGCYQTWARRSTFTKHQYKILLLEWFMPAMEQYPCSNP